MDNNEFTEFTIENIFKFLTHNKNLLVGMNLDLDSHEISKSLTVSLNRFIIGTKTKLSDLYESIINNFDEITDKINIIENNINKFNIEQKLGYYIDIDNIIILNFYKQLIFIQKLISEINNFINSNINLVYVNFYLLSKLYDEPNKISFNYIYILKKNINSPNFDNKYNNKLKEFLNFKNLDIIFNIIKIIYNSDNDFSKLFENLKKEKMEEYKKNNIIEHSDSYNEIKNNFKKMYGGINLESDVFNKIEQQYIQKKNYIFLQKRNINIENLLNIDNINLFLNDTISIDLWHAYNLFIYKRFNFDFNDYQIKINDIIKQKQFDKIYLLNLDYLNDLDVPDAGLDLQGIIGGSVNLNNLYQSKYLKYKKKYIKLKLSIKNSISK